MGGIAGLFHLKGAPPDRADGHRMSEVIAPRGPDDQGLWAEGPALMVQRRMAWTPAGRRQPIVSGDQVLVMDGRLSEPEALTRSLEARGVAPETGGDADLMLSAWRAWGEDAPERARGDFAAAIWERREQALYLVRDRVGVRPLYYVCRGGRMAFASDVRALLLLDWVSREVAHEEIAEYLAFRYTLAPRTLLRDVRQLPAGHMARIDARGVKTWRWWRPSICPPDTPLPDDELAAQQLEGALEGAVRRCVSGDHPVGVFLSGGTDSSLIASVARRVVSPLRTFHVALEGRGASEGAFAARAAKLLGAEHEELWLDREAFLGAAQEVVSQMGQPVPTASAIPQLLLCKRAREDCRILLSGYGGDELLGGNRAVLLLTELRKASLAARLPPSLRMSARSRLRGRSKALLSTPERYGLTRLVGGSDVFDVEARMALLRDPAHVRPDMRRVSLEPLYNEAETDPINQALHVYFRGWLAEDSLLRTDRLAAAAGLEARFPMLDDEVIALCHSWPGRAKIKRRLGRWFGKWPARVALEGALPRRLVWRPKRGLPDQLNAWLREEGERFLWERVDAICEDPLGLFQSDHVREMARQHAQGRQDRGPQLWTLIFFDLWWRELNGR